MSFLSGSFFNVRGAPDYFYSYIRPLELPPQMKVFALLCFLYDCFICTGAGFTYDILKHGRPDIWDLYLLLNRHLCYSSSEYENKFVWIIDLSILYKCSLVKDEWPTLRTES